MTDEKCFLCGGSMRGSQFKPDAIMCDNEDCPLCAVSVGVSERRIISAVQESARAEALREAADLAGKTWSNPSGIAESILALIQPHAGPR